MNRRVIFAIAEKDLKESLKNLYVLFALIMPIGISLLFRVIMPGDVTSAGELVIAVQQDSPSQFVQNVDNVENVRLVPAGNGVSLADAMKNNNAVGGIVVPAGLDEAIKQGEQPEISVYIAKERGGGEVSVFQSIIRDQAWNAGGQQMPVRLNFASVSAIAPDSGSESVDVNQQLASYFLLLSLVMGLAMTGMFAVPYVLAEEKEKGTLKALLVSPAREADIVIGKALMGLIYCAIIAVILLVMNDGLSGNWPITVLVVALGSIFLVVAGLLFGTISQTMSQVNTWSSFALLALLVPSMFTMITPPGPVEWALKVIPTTYMVHPLQLSLAGKAGIGDVWIDLVVLAGATIAVFAAMVWRLRSAED